MNEYAFRHQQRLDFVAQKLARDIAAMRTDPHLPVLYRELYESLEARLAAVTAAGIRFGRWLRQHPDAPKKRVRRALIKMEIPVTRPELRRAIRKIQHAVRQRVRTAWRQMA